MASKAIGEKMKKKEPAGDSDALEAELLEGLAVLSLQQCAALSVTQIKRIRTLVDTAIEENGVKLVELETERDSLLRKERDHQHGSSCRALCNCLLMCVGSIADWNRNHKDSVLASMEDK